jgi:S-adenosylmethionine/arginine decarboxylase-like enzyme
MDKGYFGLSTSIDLIECDIDHIQSEKIIQMYIDRLCELIEMKKFGDSDIVHFGDDKVSGYTFTQLIETSLLSGHFCERKKSAYIDIFSCKEYSAEKISKFTESFFCGKLKQIHSMYRW